MAGLTCPSSRFHVQVEGFVNTGRLSGSHRRSAPSVVHLLPSRSGREGKSLHSVRECPERRRPDRSLPHFQKRLPGLMSSTVIRVPVAVPFTGGPRELPSGS